MDKLMLLFLLLMICFPIAYAADFDTDISDEDKATFDQILEPVMKIYSFVKYAATVLAVVFLVFAGIAYTNQFEAFSIGKYINDDLKRIMQLTFK